MSQQPATRLSLEEDLDLAQRIATDGLILKTRMGSEVHGLDRPGISDHDHYGVCIEPPVYLTGPSYRNFDYYQQRDQPIGAPSQPGDTELTVHGLRKYLRMASSGSPTPLLSMFVSDADVLHVTPIGREVRQLSDAFVTQTTATSFLGYLTRQQRGFLGKLHATVRERELSSAHGYDTKFAMHALRVGIQGIEYLTTGTMLLPMTVEDRAYLMSVRAGDVPREDILRHMDELIAGLQTLQASPDLPPTVDYGRINRFAIDVYLRAWNGEMDLPQVS